MGGSFVFHDAHVDSEVSLLDLVLSFCPVGLGAKTQTIWLDSRCLYPLSYLANPEDCNI